MAEKINLKSENILEENISKLKEIFPQVFSEGKIDFKKLKETLGNSIDTNDEKYTFSWAGRADSIKNIQTPTHGTLVPQKDESINFDGTENIFIEGENLEVLKLLQKTYSNKINIIYIDPPYNTGKDFIYKDDFSNNLDNYLKQTGQKKEEIKLNSNPETSGRFHSDWISFMFPRLFLARELLKDDGLIFVSIDDNEINNLRNIMNEIFGEENFQGCVSRVTGTPTGAGTKAIVNEIDYILIYSKLPDTEVEGLELSEEDEKIYDKEDENGKYLTRLLRRTGGEDRREDRPTMFYPLKTPEGTEIFPIAPEGYESRWRCGFKKYKELESNNFIEWNKIQKNGESTWQVYQKFYLEGRTKQPTNLWNDIEGNKKATRDIKELFDGKKVFDFPKPVELIQKIIQLSTSQTDSIILDFFTGSGTTAHSVLQQNIHHDSMHKFICIQLPEKIDEDTVAFKEGFSTIAEISKERIRRVIKKINDENKQQKLNSKQNQDLGFKVFKLTKSNYKVWQNVKDEAKLKDQLKLFEDPLIENYKDIDVIYEIILKEGYSLNSEITEITTNPNKIYKVSDGEFFFYVTLDEKIDEKALDDLNLDKNIMFVCLDLAINDSQKTNLDKLCKLRTI
jgi:adenine-specific DNA-methyltransferase